MTNLHIYRRSDWGARSPIEGREGKQALLNEAYLHHSADTTGKAFNTLDRQKAHMRSVQDFHMGPERGWADIGYHFVVFQYVGKACRHEPRIFAGRPVTVVPAAQEGHNTGTLAVCIAGNGNVEDVTPETARLIAALIRQYPNIGVLRPHSANPAHPGGTDCPGDKFRHAIPEIARLAKVEH